MTFFSHLPKFSNFSQKFSNSSPKISDDHFLAKNWTVGCPPGTPLCKPLSVKRPVRRDQVQILPFHTRVRLLKSLSLHRPAFIPTLQYFGFEGYVRLAPFLTTVVSFSRLWNRSQTLQSALQNDLIVPWFQTSTHTWAWWLIGSFVAIRPKGRGFESHSSRPVGTLGRSFTRNSSYSFSLCLEYSLSDSMLTWLN